MTGGIAVELVVEDGVDAMGHPLPLEREIECPAYGEDGPRVHCSVCRHTHEVDLSDERQMGLWGGDDE